MTGRDLNEFAALMKAWSAAIVENDPAAIEAFVEPDWVLVGQTGIQSREEFLAEVASGNLTHEAMSHLVHRVQIYGDVALVTARVTNRGTFRGTAFESDEWNTDVYVLRNGTWRCALTHLSPAIET
jgi:ketosteroid isomerase-like protein